jgi:CBS domain-containing protein
VHDEDEGRLVEAVARFAVTQVRDVMTPRPDIVAISGRARVGDLRRILRETKYSRVPVHGENLDDILGVVTVRDLIEYEGGDADPLAPLVRAAFLVPETKKETSVSEALAAGEPFVLVFATPKFCVSAQCGPTLDRLKPIAAAHPELTFINVEPYQLEAVEGQLQPILTGEPPQLTPATATNEWRLAAEPWVFVVDGDGIVTASFMLIFSDEELETAIAAVE